MQINREHGNSQNSMQESSTSPPRQGLHMNVLPPPPLPRYRPPIFDTSSNPQRTSTTSKQLMTKLEELQERLKASREQSKSSLHIRRSSASTISTVVSCPSPLSFESPTLSSLSSLTLDTQQVQQAKQQWQQPLEQHKPSSSSAPPIQKEMKETQHLHQQVSDIQHVQQQQPPPILEEIDEMKDEVDDDLVSLESAIHMSSSGDLESGNNNNNTGGSETPQERIFKLKEEALDYLSKTAANDASLITTYNKNDDYASFSDNDSDANPDEISEGDDTSMHEGDHDSNKENGENTNFVNLRVESLQRQWEEPPDLAPLGDDLRTKKKENLELNAIEEGKGPRKSVSFAADGSNTVHVIDRRMTFAGHLRRLVKRRTKDNNQDAPKASKGTRSCLLLTFAILFLSGGAAAIIIVIHAIAG